MYPTFIFKSRTEISNEISKKKNSRILVLLKEKFSQKGVTCLNMEPIQNYSQNISSSSELTVKRAGFFLDINLPHAISKFTNSLSVGHRNNEFKIEVWRLPILN